MPTLLIEDRLSELLLRWDELRRQGYDETARELCTDCPELVEELARRIEAIRDVDFVLDIDDSGDLWKPRGRAFDGARGNGELPDSWRAAAEYRPQRHHAHGGLGQIVVAHQQELDRPVALKRIRPDKLDDQARNRFLREAAITARLQHPGIVPIYGLGHDDDGPFYTMPSIQGRTLHEALAGLPRDDAFRRDPGRRSVMFRDLLQQFVTVCNTMAYAHDQGIVHRDLKPSNIMLGRYGETLVMDWGLAKPFDSDDAINESEEETPSPSPSPDDLTVTGDRTGHAAVYEPGAGQWPARRPRQRHLQPGIYPLRDPDREVRVR